MIKVVLDTNVVVSALLAQEGNPAIIFKMLLLEKIKNSTTAEIINECKEVLDRPRITKRTSLVEREFILRAFEGFSDKISPGLTFDEIKEDPDDNKILECAVAAAADYIVSGDEHLLKLPVFRGVKIVSPAEFVQIMDALKE